MPTDEELALIDLAAATYRYAGAREAVMADRFGLSPTRFWQKVHALRVRGDVVAVRAGECRRLTSLAEARAAARGSSRSDLRAFPSP